MSLLMAAEEGASPLRPDWWEVLITGLGFLILLYIVVKFIAPTFEKIYQDRLSLIHI